MSAGWPLTSGIAQVTSGTLSRAGRVLPPGSPVGEIGFLTPNNQRNCDRGMHGGGASPNNNLRKAVGAVLSKSAIRLLLSCADQPTPTTEHRACGKNHRTERNGDRPAGGKHRTTRSSSKRNRLARCLEQREHAEHPLGPHAFTRLDLQNDGALFAGNVVRSCGQATSGRGAAFAKQKRNAGKPQELCPGSQPCMPSVP
jgi:hypothetical protein